MFTAYAHRYVDFLTGISGHTRTDYRRFIDNHLAPWFQGLAVSDCEIKIGRDHVSQWVNDLQARRPGPRHEPGTERRPYKPKTFANLHGLLYGILQCAVDADPALRDSNPCAHIRLPKSDEAEDEEVSSNLRSTPYFAGACVPTPSSWSTPW